MLKHPLFQVAMAAKERLQITSSCFQLREESNAEQSPHSHVLSINIPCPSHSHKETPFFLFFVWGEGGGGQGGRRKWRLSKECESLIPPFHGLSTALSQKGGSDSRSWHRVPELHAVPGLAVNCWAAAAGSALPWLPPLCPGMFQGRSPAGPWCPAGNDIHSPVLPSSCSSWPQHLPGLTFPQQEGLMEKGLCFKTLWMAFIFRHFSRYRGKAYCSYGKRSLQRHQYLK